MLHHTQPVWRALSCTASLRRRHLLARAFSFPALAPLWQGAAVRRKGTLAERAVSPFSSCALPQRWCSSVTTPPPSVPPDVSPNADREDGPSELVVGNSKLGVHSNLDTVYRRSEFIGVLTPPIHTRADAGDVLALIDICVGKAAYYHIHQRVFEGRWLPTTELSMATVSFNSFMFTQPIFHGDLILLETRVIHTGNSSIGVHVCVRRQACDSPTPSLVGESYVTMVIVHAAELTKVASGFVPAVRLVEAVDVERHGEYLELRRLAKSQVQRQVPETLSASEVEHPENRKKQDWRRLEDCICRMDRSFAPADVNVNNAIFGGVLLRFMEKCALHCGRVFARKAGLFTLGMLDMTFDGPLFLHDLARCSAQVVCVRRSTLLVDVSVAAVDGAGVVRSTNRASFLLVAVDPQGKPFELPYGIDLHGASQSDLARYWRGRCYMEEATRRRRYSSKSL